MTERLAIIIMIIIALKGTIGRAFGNNNSDNNRNERHN